MTLSTWLVGLGVFLAPVLFGSADRSSVPAEASALQPTRRALIIAIGDYPRIGGWDKLSSARDAELIGEALRARGFEDIQLLVDREATKAGILAAFAALTERSGPGDLVVLHFSGHGQQVWDHDDPANPTLRVDEPDNYDESLVPYDARDSFTPGVYEGENHLVDDEISGLLTALRARLGAEGQLLFTVDACYSGSISRSAMLAKVRGTSKLLAPEQHPAPVRGGDAGSGWSETFVATGSPLAQMAVISAARADQPNYETTDPEGAGVGSLSLSLSRTLVKPFETVPSLGTFFRYVEADMAREAPFQSPQLEGDAGRQLFGSTLVDAGGYPVLEFRAGDRSAVLRAGLLSGLYPGTTVRLEASGAEPLLGEVRESGATTTVVTLPALPADPDPVRWQASVEDRFLIFQPVRLALALEPGPLRTQLEEAVAETPRLEVVETGADLLVDLEGSGSLRLSDRHEQSLGSYAPDPPGPAIGKLLRRVETYARAQYFWSLSGQHAATDPLRLQVVPVVLEQQGGYYRVQATREVPEAEQDVLNLDMGDPFVFQVTNLADSPRYVHVMGVDADDAVFLCLPDAQNAPAEFFVGPGATVAFRRPEWIFQLAEPAGKQLFVAIASPAPVDLRPVFRQLDGPTRSAPVPEGAWLSELLLGRTRSAGLGGGLETASVVVDIHAP